MSYWDTPRHHGSCFYEVMPFEAVVFKQLNERGGTKVIYGLGNQLKAETGLEYLNKKNHVADDWMICGCFY